MGAFLEEPPWRRAEKLGRADIRLFQIDDSNDPQVFGIFFTMTLDGPKSSQISLNGPVSCSG